MQEFRVPDSFHQFFGDPGTGDLGGQVPEHQQSCDHHQYVGQLEFYGVGQGLGDHDEAELLLEQYQRDGRQQACNKTEAGQEESLEDKNAADLGDL